MRALIVGVDGFVGRWLARHLAGEGDYVEGIVGPRFGRPLDHVAATHAADVREYAGFRDAISRASPDVVYYLAAVSDAAGREHLEDATRISVAGAVHAMAACAALDHPPRLVHVSSSHVYGGGDEPLTEESETVPGSVYGAVKLASERALLTLAPAAGVEVIVARPFNHIGPGQAPGFLVPSLAARVRAIRRGERGTITVGALDTVRDFTDVRDVVRAYRILAASGEPGSLYNVASGTGTSVRELVTAMTELAGVEADITVDSALVREGERRVLVGDATKLRSLGWRPTHGLRQTLTEVLT